MTLRFQIFLFKDCCNKCDFCFQDKTKLNSRFDKNIIKQNIEVLSNALANENDLSKYSLILVTIFGGELFCWHDKELYELYKEIVDLLTKYNIHNNIMLRTVTNLLYEDTTYLEDFIQYVQINNLKLNLATSFDFKSRFHDEIKLELFFKNYIKIQKVFNDIEVVCTLTKELCNEFKNRQLLEYWKVFDYIYSVNPSNFEWLMYLKNANEEHNKTFLPDDEDLFGFYKALQKYYPVQYDTWFEEFKDVVKRPCFSNDLHNLILNGKIHDEYQYLLNPDDKNTPWYRKCHFNFMNSMCLVCEYNSKCSRLCYCIFEFKQPSNNICYVKQLFKLNEKDCDW